MRNRTQSNETGGSRPRGKSGAPRRRPALFLEERRSRINELIGARDRATVQELAARFGVSAVTIRSDLDALAKAGGLIRSHGGALRRDDETEEMPLVLNQTLHRGGKMRIADAAGRMIRKGETSSLHSGKRTAAIASA